MRLLVSVFICLMLIGCSSNQVAKLQSGLANFSAGVASVDATFATVSPTLHKYCTTAQTVGQSLAPLVGSSSSASGGLASVNAGITAWCQAPPNDTASAIASVIAIINAGRAAYKAAQAGN